MLRGREGNRQGKIPKLLIRAELPTRRDACGADPLCHSGTSRCPVSAEFYRDTPSISTTTLLTPPPYSLSIPSTYIEESMGGRKCHQGLKSSSLSRHLLIALMSPVSLSRFISCVTTTTNLFRGRHTSYDFRHVSIILVMHQLLSLRTLQKACITSSKADLGEARSRASSGTT